MKIINKVSELVDYIYLMSYVAEKNKNNSVLSNILFESSKSVLKLVSSNLDLQITSYIKLDYDPGCSKFSVSAKKIMDIFKFIPDSTTINLEYKNNISKLELKFSRCNYQLNTIASSEFELLDTEDIDDNKSISFSSESWIQSFSMVQSAIGSMGFRYYLNGVAIYIIQGYVLFIASDGHRLAVYKRALDHVLEESKYIIPYKSVNTFVKAIKNNQDNVKLILNEGQAIFRSDKFELVSKMIDGSLFPDHSRIIPDDYFHISLVYSKDFLVSLNRVSVVCDSKLMIVKLDFYDNLMKLYCINVNNEDASEELDIDYSGERISVSYNLEYIIDALNSMSNSSVSMHISKSNNSLRIGKDNSNEFYYYIMPVFS